jgi:hypothetical protein
VLRSRYAIIEGSGAIAFSRLEVAVVRDHKFDPVAAKTSVQLLHFVVPQFAWSTHACT